MKKAVFIIFSLLFSSSAIHAQTWEFVGLDSLAVYHLFVSGDTIFAGTIDRNINPTINDGLYFSSNGGNDWIQLDSTLGDGYINGLYIISPENLFILKSGTIFKTTNNGQSWSPVNNFSTKQIRWFGISPFNQNELYAIDEIVVPGGVLNNLFRSTDNGINWVVLGPFPGSSHGSELRFSFALTDSMNLYVSVDDHFTNLYFFKSIDKGENWFYVSWPPFLPNDIYTDKIIPNRIYLFPGPYVSNQGGLNWLLVDSGLTDTSHYLSFFQDPLTTNLLYILKSDGLYYSHLDTFFWQRIDGSENLPLDLPPSTRNMKNIIIDGETRKIYLGTSDGLFRTNILTGISNEKENLIDRFVLEQNYPNPFNPITTITYQIPKTSFVTIKVYDVLGNEIATLVNEELEAGKYEIDFIARDLPSGIYFYTFRSGSFAETKKMLLLK